MTSLVYPKFIESHGYWFNIVKLDNDKYAIQNTMRKENQTDRDGLPFLIGHDYFDSLEKAKEYLEGLDKQ